MALSKAWSAANPTSKVGSNDFPADPFNPALSNGQLEQSGAIDKELWKAQYENLQDYFKSEVGKLPDWSSLKRRDLEDIMKRFSSYNKPDRTKTEAMLALLAHYQWLYAKD
jgi:hypothetical protein